MPRTSHAPWTYRLVKGMNSSLHEYLRCIIYGDDNKNTEWSTDLELLPVAYNSQITTTLGLSPYEIVLTKNHVKPQCSQQTPQKCSPQKRFNL